MPATASSCPHPPRTRHPTRTDDVLNRRTPVPNRNTHAARPARRNVAYVERDADPAILADTRGGPAQERTRLVWPQALTNRALSGDSSLDQALEWSPQDNKTPQRHTEAEPREPATPSERAHAEHAPPSSHVGEEGGAAERDAAHGQTAPSSPARASSDASCHAESTRHDRPNPWLAAAAEVKARQPVPSPNANTPRGSSAANSPRPWRPVGYWPACTGGQANSHAPSPCSRRPLRPRRTCSAPTTSTRAHYGDPRPLLQRSSSTPRAHALLRAREHAHRAGFGLIDTTALFPPRAPRPRRPGRPNVLRSNRSGRGDWSSVGGRKGRPIPRGG